MPDREITNETKYQFEYYTDFERWFCGMLRSVAIEKESYRFNEKPKFDAIDAEIEEMDERREKLKQGE